MTESNVAHSLQIRTLAARPTIVAAGCCDLKLENEAGERWWLCRKSPGQTDHRITIERYDPATGGYTTFTTYVDEEPQ